MVHHHQRAFPAQSDLPHHSTIGGYAGGQLLHRIWAVRRKLHHNLLGVSQWHTRDQLHYVVPVQQHPQARMPALKHLHRA